MECRDRISCDRKRSEQPGKDLLMSEIFGGTWFETLAEAIQWILHVMASCKWSSKVSDSQVRK